MGRLDREKTDIGPNAFFLNMTVHSGGYIGFSGFGGDPIVGTGDMVTITNFYMWNLDMNTPGEDSEVLKHTLGDLDVGDILRDHSHVKDQRDLTGALKQLTRLIYKHVSEAGPREQSILRTLNSLMTSMHKLYSKVAELEQDVRGAGGGHNHSETMHAMKSDLMGLRSLFHRHSQQQTNSLSSLHNALSSGGGGNAQEVKELAQKAAALENTIRSHTSVSSYLTLGILVSVLVFAGMVWKKMREMEKKHFL